MKYKGKTYYTREDLRKMGITEGTIVNWFSRGKRTGVEMIEVKKKVLAIDEDTLNSKMEVMKKFQKKLKIDERRERGEWTETEGTEGEEIGETQEIQGVPEEQGAHWC